jgi:hypothetical protein
MSDDAILLGAPERRRRKSPRHSKGADSWRLTGWFPSRKNAMTFHWNRPLHRDFMVLLEADPRVCKFEFRPERIRVFSDGGWVDHVVGFRAQSSQGACFFDVAQGDWLERMRSGLRDKLRNHYAERGLKYVLLGDADVRAEPRLWNARRLLRASATEIRPELERDVRLALLHGPRRLRDLAGELNTGAAGYEPLLALAVRGAVEVDLDDRIGPDTEVRLPGDAR